MAGNPFEFITALGGILGAVAGIYAARAASRSASLAQEAATQAERAERRGLMRDFVASAQRVLVECSRIESIAADLKSQYRTLFTFAGQYGGSRQQRYVEQIDSKLQSIASVQDEARKLAGSHRHLTNTSEEDMNLALSKLEADLVTVQGIREELRRELTEISTQNDRYRKGQINSKP